MLKINEHYQALPGNYLFAEIARRTAEYGAANPEKELIKLGIGDVTLPLSPAVIAAMHSAVDEMADAATFMGYGPYEGYAFLREAIVRHDYAPVGAAIAADEIFVSDGAKSDCGNIGDIISADSTVAVCDPVYPVYVDANAMSGRAGDWDGRRWTNIVYLPCNEANGFMPELPVRVPDLIYLCFPNNPTGAAATREQLKIWVDYANRNASVILYDSAYRAYITEPGIPRSIYEIDGAEECAIEFCSFSKTAGFTGTRCGYTVIPKALRRGGESLNDMWMRRQSTKFNGVSYIVQRGAEAVFTEQGLRETRALIAYYMNNARVIRDGLKAAGLTVYGGINAPYVWIKTPGGLPSWDFFDKLLRTANVVTTPGAGFGPEGEGFIRLTGFGDAERTGEAVSRVAGVL
ncbi:MAG: LL-diaminopimelate aminotransferase [Oscillospiraceae bacterium]|jgi:LL-diaminopimelate aminotransferase|nr:LL-diaminopimelate aminotransferase [Oscillospiraceae bacterium]